MSGDNFLLLLRLGFSLSIVFGLMWGAAKVARGKGAVRKRLKADHLEVVERKSLTKNSSIAIVRVGDETLTVGITDASVTLLGRVEIDDDANNGDIEVDAARETATPVVTDVTTALATIDLRVATPARRSVLDVLRDKTVRHIAG